MLLPEWLGPQVCPAAPLSVSVTVVTSVLSGDPSLPAVPGSDAASCVPLSFSCLVVVAADTTWGQWEVPW